MGTRGPPPKRADKRLGHVAKAKKEAVERVPGAAAVKVPAAKADWHPLAKRWWWSLVKSGQSVYYEPADWETAWVLAESMSREFKPQVVGTFEGEPVWAEVPPRGTALSAWRQMMAALLVTEGDRRRAGLELQRPAPAEEAETDVSELAEYRRRLQSG